MARPLCLSPAQKESALSTDGTACVQHVPYDLVAHAHQHTGNAPF